MCVGYFRIQRDREYKERQMHWLLYLAVADLKKTGMTIDKFWPINGEKINRIKPPTQKRLLQLTELFKNFGKKK